MKIINTNSEMEFESYILINDKMYNKEDFKPILIDIVRKRLLEFIEKKTLSLDDTCYFLCEFKTFKQDFSIITNKHQRKDKTKDSIDTINITNHKQLIIYQLINNFCKKYITFISIETRSICVNGYTIPIGEIYHLDINKLFEKEEIILNNLTKIINVLDKYHSLTNHFKTLVDWCLENV